MAKISIDSRGNIYYRDEDKRRHNDNGPAVHTTWGGYLWFKRNRRHREDGPYRNYPNGYKYWCVEGIPVWPKLK